MQNRLTVTEASERMGITEQMLRIAMQKRMIDIGFVFGKGKRKTYVIYESKVKEITDAKVEIV